MNTVSQAEFARMCNVNRSTVNRWIKNGRIETDSNGKINPEAAKRMRVATESPEPHHQARKAQIDADKAMRGATASMQQPATDEQPQGMERIGAALKLETFKLQRARAEKAAMEVDKMSGSLVERAEIDFVMTDLGKTLSSLLDAMPDRYSGPVAAHRGDTSAVHRVLEEAKDEIKLEFVELMKQKIEAIGE